MKKINFFLKFISVILGFLIIYKLYLKSRFVESYSSKTSTTLPISTSSTIASVSVTSNTPSPSQSQSSLSKSTPFFQSFKHFYPLPTKKKTTTNLKLTKPVIADNYSSYDGKNLIYTTAKDRGFVYSN